MPYRIKDPTRHFWGRVNPGLNGCLEWHGSSNQYGYGRVQRNNRMLLAHRYAWEMANGPIPEGLRVLHNCDNPRCVNVEHLRLGTQLDNVRDMDSRGRRVTKSYAGEDKANAKLTWAQVAEIRAARGKTFQRDLAVNYGVSYSLIQKIHEGRAWKDEAIRRALEQEAQEDLSTRGKGERLPIAGEVPDTRPRAKSAAETLAHA